MNYPEIYKSKLGTLEGALRLIEDGEVISMACYGNTPAAFMSGIDRIAPELNDITVWMGGIHNCAALTPGNGMTNFRAVSTFYGKTTRELHKEKRATLVPTHLSSMAVTKNNACHPTMYVIAVSPMDENGNVYVSFDMEGAKEGIANAEKVIFEINKNIPKVYGDTSFPITDATYIYEAESPITICPNIPMTDVERKIGEYVAELINDGDCLQLGIGGIPNAVGAALRDKKDLGIHTEMLTTLMGDLIREGVVTNERKNFKKGISIGSFAWGDQKLYDLMADNPKIQLYPSAWTNDPFVIMQNDNMVSVNTAIQVDLTGQICSESIGTVQYSGTGGAHDFAYGAFRSKGGKGIIAMTSTAKKGTISKIQPILTPGSVVSISRNIADYVVTEYGIAKLRDRTIGQRVEALIAISHPDFRKELREQAEKMRIW